MKVVINKRGLIYTDKKDKLDIIRAIEETTWAMDYDSEGHLHLTKVTSTPVPPTPGYPRDLVISTGEGYDENSSTFMFVPYSGASTATVTFYTDEGEFTYYDVPLDGSEYSSTTGVAVVTSSLYCDSMMWSFSKGDGWQGGFTLLGTKVEVSPYSRDLEIVTGSGYDSLNDHFQFYTPRDDSEKIYYFDTDQNRYSFIGVAGDGHEFIDYSDGATLEQVWEDFLECYVLKLTLPSEQVLLGSAVSRI